MATNEHGQITGAAILASLAMPSPRLISTPEWSSCPHVYIRPWKGTDLTVYRSLMRDRDADDVSEEEFVWHIMKLSLCDAEGTLILSDDMQARVMGGPLSPIRRLEAAILEFNGLTQSADKAILGN